MFIGLILVRDHYGNASGLVRGFYTGGGVLQSDAFTGFKPQLGCAMKLDVRRGLSAGNFIDAADPVEAV